MATGQFRRDQPEIERAHHALLLTISGARRIRETGIERCCISADTTVEPSKRYKLMSVFARLRINARPREYTDTQPDAGKYAS